MLDAALNEDAASATAMIEELIALNEVYASPLHFTPFLYGSALSLYARGTGD